MAKKYDVVLAQAEDRILHLKKRVVELQKRIDEVEEQNSRLNRKLKESLGRLPVGERESALEMAELAKRQATEAARRFEEERSGLQAEYDRRLHAVFQKLREVAPEDSVTAAAFQVLAAEGPPVARKAAPKPRAAEPPKPTDRRYLCSKCGMPKRGHVCQATVGSVAESMGDGVEGGGKRMRRMGEDEEESPDAPFTRSGASHTKTVPDSRDLEAQAERAVGVLRRGSPFAGMTSAEEVATAVRVRLEACGGEPMELVNCVARTFQYLDVQQETPSAGDVLALKSAVAEICTSVVPDMLRIELEQAVRDGVDLGLPPPYLLAPDFAHSNALLTLLCTSLVFVQWCLRTAAAPAREILVDFDDPLSWYDGVLSGLVETWRLVIDNCERAVLGFLTERFFQSWYMRFSELSWTQWSGVLMKGWTVTIKRQLVEIMRSGAAQDPYERRVLIESLSADGSVKTTDDVACLCGELLLNPGPVLEGDDGVVDGALDLAVHAVQQFSNAKHAILHTLVRFFDSKPQQSSAARVSRVLLGLKDSLRTCSEFVILALSHRAWDVARSQMIQVLEHGLSSQLDARWEDTPAAVNGLAVPDEETAHELLYNCLISQQVGAAPIPLELPPASSDPSGFTAYINPSLRAALSSSKRLPRSSIPNDEHDPHHTPTSPTHHHDDSIMHSPSSLHHSLIQEHSNVSD